jgi:hypothetical protein
MGGFDNAGACRNLSSEERQLVMGTLQSVLDSPHFAKSKRYPALLEFAVRAALEDGSNPVKERTVGVQVFGRPADYDTSADAVVRTAAGEVRRRTAAYFSEHSEAPVRIDIPVGGYKAEFHFRSMSESVGFAQEPQTQIPTDEGSDLLHAIPGKSQEGQTDSPLAAAESKKTPRRRIARPRLALAVMLLLIVACAGWWYQLDNRGQREFWLPVLHSNQPGLILVGRMNAPASSGAAGGHPVATASALGTPQNLTLNDAIVTAQMCGVFREYRLECKIAPAELAGMEDLHGKSVVLVGAFNNPWTLRILASLPYQFRSNATTQPVPQIVRSIVEQNSAGSIVLGSIVNGDDPSSEFSKDYAIIGRFHSDITDGMVVVVAGLGLPGTSSAGQYVDSPDKMHEVFSLAPKDWKGGNFEAVLQVGVVQGSAGHVQVIASHFW